MSLRPSLCLWLSLVSMAPALGAQVTLSVDEKLRCGTALGVDALPTSLHPGQLAPWVATVILEARSIVRESGRTEDLAELRGALSAAVVPPLTLYTWLNDERTRIGRLTFLVEDDNHFGVDARLLGWIYRQVQDSEGNSDEAYRWRDLLATYLEFLERTPVVALRDAIDLKRDLSRRASEYRIPDTTLLRLSGLLERLRKFEPYDYIQNLPPFAVVRDEYFAIVRAEAARVSSVDELRRLFVGTPNLPLAEAALLLDVNIYRRCNRHYSCQREQRQMRLFEYLDLYYDAVRRLIGGGVVDVATIRDMVELPVKHMLPPDGSRELAILADFATDRQNTPPIVDIFGFFQKQYRQTFRTYLTQVSPDQDVSWLPAQRVRAVAAWIEAWNESPDKVDVGEEYQKTWFDSGAWLEVWHRKPSDNYVTEALAQIFGTDEDAGRPWVAGLANPLLVLVEHRMRLVYGVWWNDPLFRRLVRALVVSDAPRLHRQPTKLALRGVAGLARLPMEHDAYYLAPMWVDIGRWLVEQGQLTEGSQSRGQQVIDWMLLYGWIVRANKEVEFLDLPLSPSPIEVFASMRPTLEELAGFVVQIPSAANLAVYTLVERFLSARGEEVHSIPEELWAPLDRRVRALPDSLAVPWKIFAERVVVVRAPAPAVVAPPAVTPRDGSRVLLRDLLQRLWPF